VDAIAWGLPVLLFLLVCPLMMVGMGVAAWFGVRFLGRSAGLPVQQADQRQHGSHACGPMMMGRAHQGGSCGDHGATSEDEVSALRARVDDLERRLSEARVTGTGASGARSS
jgi:hypothetical protein